MFAFITLALDYELPRPSIDGVDDSPNPYYRDKPITSVAQMLPKLGKADVERKQHHHNGGQAEQEEQVVQAIPIPHLLNVTSFFIRKPPSFLLRYTIRDED